MNALRRCEYDVIAAWRSARQPASLGGMEGGLMAGRCQQRTEGEAMRRRSRPRAAHPNFARFARAAWSFVGCRPPPRRCALSSASLLHAHTPDRCLAPSPRQQPAAHMAGQPQNQNQRRWLAARWSPLVLVISSPEAEALCHASGLSVVDLLAPHCSSTPNGACVGATRGSSRRRRCPGAACACSQSERSRDVPCQSQSAPARRRFDCATSRCAWPTPRTASRCPPRRALCRGGVVREQP